jgi:DNA-binding transcriptional LysR family regulator
MDWNELRAFAAVADHGSFSKAAHQLHLTQPAVSKRIQSLETELAVRLFDRVGKRVYLTDAGRLLRPRVDTILHELADTQTLLKNLHGRIDGVLSLATSHHVGLHRLAPVLRDFSQRYPGVRLDIKFVDSEIAHDMVSVAETELAVVTLDPAATRPLTSTKLWHDPLVFTVARDHALAKAKPPLPLSELARHHAILPGLDTFTGRIVMSVFDRAGLTLTTSMSTNYLETIAMLVGIGLGWSLLPQTLLAEQMVALDVSTDPLERHLGCVTNPERTLSNAARAFVEVLAAYGDRTADSQSGF